MMSTIQIPPPEELLDLIARFDEQVAAYRAGNYNETQVRREFIDKLFGFLGWDVDNRQGCAEQYKDVIHEDAIRVGGLTKAPDYCFRIGGTRKFFVEAKKPSVNVKEDISAAYQVRRYAWSAKLPLSILTDFEEFAVYDCRKRPEKGDSAATGRIMYLTYKDYAAQWSHLAGTFSKDAVLRGAFDKWAESTKGKRGTTEVDAAFLSEIESWRDTLARHLALRNPALTQRELNFAVQRTIDRIIFLRICEDRGIEKYGQLQTLINGLNIYPQLCTIFDRADERYNSGLFHFHGEKGRSEAPDELSKTLSIDDKVLKDILKRLYYPDSPYEFSVLPADILGQVYEQFLGKVIRLTAGHQARVEEKPEVKKAGGVYYTPTYIVDYIVRHTVGKLLEGKTPKDAAELTILDPACGSGSFLIGAYQHLLDWHLQYYLDDGPEKHAKGRDPVLVQTPAGWKLTTTERKRILLNNIYGVDIDSQAVEVTKLSLLLKVLEGETDESLHTQMSMFRERALPDLGSNIKCGNSLIGPDFYTGQQQLAILDEEEMYRINVFDWNSDTDGFGKIMKAGGFDAVIGNPPYVRQETLGADFKNYAKNNYKVYAGTADLYAYFFEKSHRLLREAGYFGMICSNKFMRANYGQPLRQFLATESELLEIVDFGELRVFLNAATFPAVYITQNRKMVEQTFTYAAVKRLDFTSLDEEVAVVGQVLDDRALAGDNWTLAGAEETAIFEKMRRIGVPLGKIEDLRIYRGILSGLNEAFVIDSETRDKLIAEDPKSAELIKPFALGDDVRNYHVRDKGRFMIIIPKGWTAQYGADTQDMWKWFASTFPAISGHLAPFAEKAAVRCDRGDYWWELRACDYYWAFDTPKILYPDIAKESRFTLDTHGFYSGNTTYIIPKYDPYLLGILNSNLIFAYYRRVAAVLGDAEKGGRLRWFTQDVERLPIRTIDFSNPADVARHDRMVSMVEQMLDLNKRLASANIEQEKTVLKRQIDATDHQIDALVYELYGLTEEEIALVEKGG